MKTPLAWHNLMHDRKRLLLAVLGIGFAVLLMFMQLGFRGAMFDSTLLVLDRLDADIVFIRPDRYTLSVFIRFPRRYLELASAHPAVVAAVPMYFENQRSTWKTDDEPAGPPIRVLAFNPRESALNIPAVQAQADRLTEPMTGLFDRKSKSDFGDALAGDVIELNGRRVRIVGEFEMGTDFADDGTLIVSDATYDALFYRDFPAGRGLEMIDFGLVRLQRGSDAEAVRDELDAMLPDDVLALTRAEYIDFETQYWSTATPIGYVFSLGTAIGFVVGMTICHQILFSDVADHLREFATLKAMGYRPPYFVGVVFQESLLLAPLGFVPGLAVAAGLYFAVAAVTGLPMNLSFERICIVFGLTVLMCIASGVLTMRKVLTVEPAELFA